MKINPIPDELLGSDIILLMPTSTGFMEIPANNVRVERSEKLESGSLRRDVITVWADCRSSTRDKFPVGAKVRYNNELFEITEQRKYYAAGPHHVKFKAVKIGDDRT